MAHRTMLDHCRSSLGSRIAFRARHTRPNNAGVLAPTLSARANALISHNSTEGRARAMLCRAWHAQATYWWSTAFIRTPRGTEFGRRILITVDFLRWQRNGVLR